MLFCFGAQTLNLERKVLIMKKILILLLTLSMIAAAFMGCSEKFGSSSKDTNGNGLRDDIELKILKAHHKKNGEEKLRLDKHEVGYYGKFNGAYIVYLKCPYRVRPLSNSGSVDDFDSVPNKNLFSSDAFGTIAWYKGETRSVLSLLDEGVLSEDDINEIRGILKEKWWKQ